jgi:hypothetical protein
MNMEVAATLSPPTPNLHAYVVLMSGNAVLADFIASPSNVRGQYS